MPWTFFTQLLLEGGSRANYIRMKWFMSGWGMCRLTRELTVSVLVNGIY